MVQMAFSVAIVVMTIAATGYTWQATGFLSDPMRLAIAVSVYFVTNTLPTAIVIALTEAKSPLVVWNHWYRWCFPYYLTGAAIVAAFRFANRVFDWHVGVLILPVVFLLYRSYTLYVSHLQSDSIHTGEEIPNAGEIAAPPAQTIGTAVPRSSWRCL